MLFNELLSGMLVLLALIAVNAFFVAAEYSLVTSRKTRIQELVDQGNAAARIVAKVMEDPERFFAAVQLGITATALAIGSFAEEPISNFFVGALGFAMPEGLAFVVGGILGLGLAAYLQVVLAELVPRAVTIRVAEPMAMFLVPPMHTIATLFTPFTWLLKQSSRLVLRLFGLNPEDATQRHYSVEELKMLVEESQRGGVLEPAEKIMLNAVFSFGDTTVREVMVPRTEMSSVNVDASLAQAVHAFSTHAHNRLLVYEDTPDKVVGVLHCRDVMMALMPSTRKPTLRQLMRDALFVPDTERADEILQQFRTRHESLAVVLDEYGGTAGLVTLTDLASRIIGEVTEGSGGSPDIQVTSDGAVLNGLTSIGDVNAAFELELIDDNYDTIGGYIMGRLDRIPREGDEIEISNAKTSQHLIARVEEMDRLRVARVRLIKKTN